MGNHIVITNKLDDFPICPAVWTHLFLNPHEGEGKVVYRNDWLPLRRKPVVGKYSPESDEEFYVQGLWFKHNLAVGEIIRTAIVSVIIAGLIGLVYGIKLRDPQTGIALAQYLCVMPTLLGLMITCYQLY
jgi:hypothetical protein